jgi:predicted GNAT family acetyltransferase
LTTVVRNEELSRFEIDVDGETAFLTYKDTGKRLVLIHTEVPEELEGRGIASAIAKAALEHARADDRVVVPICEFVRSYLDRHPDEAARTKVDARGT